MRCVAPPGLYGNGGGRTPNPRAHATGLCCVTPPGFRVLTKWPLVGFDGCVIPAEAGIQIFISKCYTVFWIPASAGMTSVYYGFMFSKIGFVNSLHPSGVIFFSQALKPVLRLGATVFVITKRSLSVKKIPPSRSGDNQQRGSQACHGHIRPYTQSIAGKKIRS